jgi:hypothetical protein
MTTSCHISAVWNPATPAPMISAEETAHWRLNNLGRHTRWSNHSLLRLTNWAMAGPTTSTEKSVKAQVFVRRHSDEARAIARRLPISTLLAIGPTSRFELARLSKGSKSKTIAQAAFASVLQEKPL